MAGREDRKAELIAALAGARRQLDRSGRELRESLDVPACVRRSVSRNMFAWLGGAALLGVVIAKLPRRTRKVIVDPEGNPVQAPKSARSGLLVTVAQFAFAAARPMLLKIAMERLRPMVEQMFTHGPVDE